GGYRVKNLAPLVIIAALALTGCAPNALEVAPGPSVMPAAEPVAVEDVRQVWADEQINDWLSYNSASSIEALSAPAYFVDSWESPEEGVLIVRTKDGAHSKVSLSMVASSILTGAKEVNTITAINEFEKIEATLTRVS
ncbi:hypothetical protein ACT3UA_18295, partial [Glutamicibacter sp. 363]